MSIEKDSHNLIQTILMWVTLAALGWIGTATWSNSIALARIQGAIVGRPELEAKLAEIKAIQTATDAQIVQIKLQIGLKQ